MTNSRDLANLGGGFIQAGGGVQRSVESKLKDVVSVLDFIPESEHAAIKNGTSNYDATAAVQAAVNTGNSVFFPKGTYKTTTTLTVTTVGQLLYGQDTSSVIQTSAAIGFDVSGGLQNGGISNLKIESPTNTNTLVKLTSIESNFKIQGVCFEGGDTQLLLTSGAASAGSYGVQVWECFFYAAATAALKVAPQTYGYSNYHTITGCEFFGNKTHVSLADCLSIYIHQCRFERKSILGSASTGVDVARVANVVFSSCYFEENNDVDVIKLGNYSNNVSVSDSLFSINNLGGANNARCLNVSGSPVYSLSVANNYFATSGASSKLVELGSANPAVFQNNRLQANSGTVAQGVTSSSGSSLVNLSDNRYEGTFTQKSNARDRALLSKAWCAYNGNSQTILDSVNIASVTRHGTGDYSFNFLTPFTNSNYTVVATALPVINSSTRTCYPVVHAKANDSVRIRMYPSGDAAGGFPDVSDLNVVVFGSVY